MTDIELVKLKELAARLLNPTDRFSEVSDKFEWEAVASPAVISELIQQLEAAQRERDEAINSHRHHAARLIDDRGQLRQRAEAAEAELKRRDEQEPVHFYREHNLYNGMTTSWVEVEAKDIDALRELTNPETAEIRTFYAAAPAAPAAAPEKVVALPAKVNGESVEHGGSGAFTMGKRCGINEGIVRCAAALDAAGVKWVEGE